MKWASAIATEDDLAAAVAAAAEDVRAQLDGTSPHLALVFSTPHHHVDWPRLPQAMRQSLPETLSIGCSGGGTIGGGHEVEGQRAVALAAALLPDVELTPFYLAPDDLPDNGAASFWQRRLELPSTASPHFLLLPEPYSCDASSLVASLDEAFPSAIKVGGLASGAAAAGDNALFLEDQTFREGTVGVALSGNLEVESIVAQGCRPVGNPMFVTGLNGPMVTGLDGRKPIEVLQELFDTLPARDQELLRHSLFVGLVMRSDQVKYGHGDFLIRNVAGFEPTSGALAVAAELEQGSVVQFHLRDAETSAADLFGHLDGYAAKMESPPAGALLFSCLGRGEHLYGEPDHDSLAFRERVGTVPLTGFFCNGEIGPVQGKTFLHGYTSSFALFRPRKP